MRSTPSSLDAETKSIIEAALNRFVNDVYAPNARRQRLNRRDIDYRAHWPALAELGVLALPVGEAFGGIGGNAQDVADALRVLARGLVLEPLIEAAVIATELLGAGLDGEAALADAVSGEILTIVVGGRQGDDLRCEVLGTGYQLSGIARVVPGAAQADLWLIAGRDASGLTRVLRASPREIEARVQTYRLMDGREAADITFRDCSMPGCALWLEGDAATAALESAAAQAVSAYAADAVGVMQSLVTMTADYLRTREQFGVPLASFQALQHRFADMHMAALESRAIARNLAHAIDAGDTAQVQWLRYAVPTVVARCGERVGHEAIQMHGGMGVTDELIVSHCNSRLVVLSQLLARWAASPAFPTSSAFDEPAFRAEVRAFVAEHLSPETRAKVENGIYLEKADYVGWQKTLRQQAWFGATWATADGGQGWSVQQEHAFLQEAAIHAAPMIIPYGVNMVGPVLCAFGTEAQKALYLQDILNSDTWWCQGYSEPNAGSDLASLKTRAVRGRDEAGDHYIVNGTKMWTTEAHWADMMHCLVRTDASGKKQQGISFLLIDMKTPGITVEPIVTIDGVHHTNQTFFDNVRVPVANLVGEEGAGWKIAKFLLSRERTFIADTGNKVRMLRQIKATVAQNAALLDPLQRTLQAARLARIEADLAALLALEHDYIAEWMSGHDDGIGASVLKVRGTEVLQAMTEFWRDAQGPYAACYDAALRASGEGLASALPWVQASAASYNYLYGRCWSIFGGTNEVQRNIIAATLLRG